MRESIELWRKQKTPWTAIPISLAALALGEVGEINAGLELVEDAIVASYGDDLRWTMAELYRVKGELLLKHGIESKDEAEAALRKAVEVARAQRAKSLELRAVVSLVRVLREQNKKAEASNMITSIYEWFTEGLDTPDLIEARQLLRELA